jgi:CubicO group peptidase (beta-lactamase class C family)
MKIKRLIVAIVILAIAGGALYFQTLLPIITGYAAKNLASGVFVSGRTQESLEKEDLNFSFIKYNHNTVNFEKRMVTSSFLWYQSKAVYNEGFGCTFLHDYKIDEVKGRPYTILPALPENPDSIPWPMGDVVTDSIPQGIDLNQLNMAIERAFIDTIPYKGTFAVAVVYKGQLVAERYRKDFNQYTKFLSWSMAKSFTNALVGILAKEGRISLNQPLPIPEWQNDGRKNITLNHLMHMTSGLEWNENYGNSSDVNIMLHKKGDMANYSSNKPLVAKPDSLWLYSSGTTNIVTNYIRQTIDNDSVYYSFPRKELFNKIGMRSAIWEVDASGNFVGSSYIYATMRDYARFGLLYLKNGNWLGQQILSEDWVNYSKAEAPQSKGRYGAFFYINKLGTDYPDVPRDLFYCRGHDGQYIYIIPSKDLVVVRTGFSKEGWFDLNKFLSSITQTVN